MGYECGRVFPAGVGLGPPSRNVANWLPSRFSLSVKTRQWYGWLRMVFSGARLFRAPIWCPLGRCGGTREAGNTVAKSLVVLYREGTHQIRRRRKEARSSTSQERAEPLCVRIKGANREVSEGKADVSDYGICSSYKGHKERRTGKIRGDLSRMHRALNGWMLARAPASLAQGVHHHASVYQFPSFLYDVWA